ncbi:hypothetical protein [Enterovibrio norvegicus]|uniref:hypothetical protein n=1 Tax=Enterovibrio norvegicus TaxID=188144 RepID=UPI000C85E294|nr:hypothetical protein [Enterovibrio norvegicus]PML80960.1 hypothetical protein BCT69_09965 [Enterovibrio norvegicus]
MADPQGVNVQNTYHRAARHIPARLHPIQKVMPTQNAGTGFAFCFSSGLETGALFSFPNAKEAGT